MSFNCIFKERVNLREIKASSNWWKSVWSTWKFFLLEKKFSEKIFGQKSLLKKNPSYFYEKVFLFEIKIGHGLEKEIFSSSGETFGLRKYFRRNFNKTLRVKFSFSFILPKNFLKKYEKYFYGLWKEKLQGPRFLFRILKGINSELKTSKKLQLWNDFRKYKSSLKKFLSIFELL